MGGRVAQLTELLEHLQSLLLTEPNGATGTELGDIHSDLAGVHGLGDTLEGLLGGQSLDNVLQSHQFPRKNGKWQARNQANTQHIQEMVQKQKPCRNRRRMRRPTTRYFAQRYNMSKSGTFGRRQGYAGNGDHTVGGIARPPQYINQPGGYTERRHEVSRRPPMYINQPGGYTDQRRRLL